jgi:hypothetical protein
VSELKSVRRGVRVDVDVGDTTRTFGLSMSSDLSRILRRKVWGFVIVEKAFGDIGERDLMVITTSEARVFGTPSV